MSKEYSNFVRPSSSSHMTYSIAQHFNGEEVRKLYLEEVRDVTVPTPTTEDSPVVPQITRNKRKECVYVSDKELFMSAQNNDIATLQSALDNNPDKIKLVDEFGWTLLMIACQANSVDSVKELLKRGIDTSIRDKAGNSAHSLVIKNKNITIANLLLDKCTFENKTKDKHKTKIKCKREEYECKICNKTFHDKEQHLSSTIHNINASRGRRIPANFKIPETNRGYQLMLKGGWDKESGLGPDGAGKKYPIKTVQKKDRKGLGQIKNEEKKVETPKQMNKRMFIEDHQHNRRMEINFRREFY